VNRTKIQNIYLPLFSVDSNIKDLVHELSDHVRHLEIRVKELEEEKEEPAKDKNNNLEKYLDSLHKTIENQNESISNLEMKIKDIHSFGGGFQLPDRINALTGALSCPDGYKKFNFGDDTANDTQYLCYK
jgi:archaellum component FlaC